MSKNIPRIVRGALFLSLIWLPSQAHASCAATSCAVNSEWGQGAVQAPGFALDLRYEFIDQNQLRIGSNKTSVGAGDELEIRTLNRILKGTLDYTVDANWGVSLSLPLLKRDHAHRLSSTQEFESWDYSRSGDARVIGRYQATAIPFERLAYGINFGVKLPTGATTVVNANGVAAERSLQPGSGSTDILLGTYVSQHFPDASARWFLQAMFQHALITYEHFTPGDQIAVDLGLSYQLFDHWSGLLQLNVVNRQSDQDHHAGGSSSGGRYVFLSPGGSYRIGSHSQVYGFIQKPLYQNVNGTQLTAELAIVVGLRQLF